MRPTATEVPMLGTSPAKAGRGGQIRVLYLRSIALPMSVNWTANSRAFDSVLDAIGRTPMVKLQHIPKQEGVRATIYAKMDFLNPSGSLKDRVYYRMITEAVKRGDLKPRMEIVEVSTGNAGIACVFVGRRLGFKVTIVMHAGMSEERKKVIRALGGEIIETPGAESDVDISCLLYTSPSPRD